MSQTSQEIDDLAVQWAVRRDLGTLSPEEEAEFQNWVAADKRHLGAYGRAEAVLFRLERLNGASLDGASSENAHPSPWERRSLVLAGGLAASIAVAIGVALHWPETAGERTFSTAIGQIREVVLEDGSVMVLNTNTKIRVRFTQEVRAIDLLRGEAQFDVAKNKKRPFIVSAGDTLVRAVGTSFTVSMLPKRPVQVLVKEGVVELQRADAAAAIPVRASANIQAIAPVGAPFVTLAVPEEKLIRDLAWQQGHIAFENKSLEEAAEEFARYSEVRIVVDPAVSDRTVTGLFASNDPIAFARAAAAVLRLRMEVRGNEVRIF